VITNLSATPPGAEPTSRLRGRLRDDVIALAMAAAQDGAIEALSMREVSRRLGVSPGAIYRHFEDREAILKAVAEAGFVLLGERFEAAMPAGSAARDGADARARFEGLALAYVTFARSHYGLWRLMFGPYGCDFQFQDPAKAPTYQWLGRSLSELRDFGVIASATPQDQDFVWTAIHGFSDLQALPREGAVDVEPSARAQARLCLRALGRAADPPWVDRSAS
jgi:AcrR family transcriptional regulator